MTLLRKPPMIAQESNDQSISSVVLIFLKFLNLQAQLKAEIHIKYRSSSRQEIPVWPNVYFWHTFQLECRNSTWSEAMVHLNQGLSFFKQFLDQFYLLTLPKCIRELFKTEKTTISSLSPYHNLVPTGSLQPDHPRFQNQTLGLPNSKPESHGKESHSKGMENHKVIITP